MILFLDIDGVLNSKPGSTGLENFHVQHLNTLIQMFPEPRIITNSAWNSIPLSELRVQFEQAGFLYPRVIQGRTPSCMGGGLPVRQWLRENNAVGEPFLILDDSTHDYGAMWCRLVWCPWNRGFDGERLRAALRVVERSRKPLQDSVERFAAVESLMERSRWALREANWLTEEGKRKVCGEALSLAQTCLDIPAFLSEACLMPFDQPETVPTPA